MVHILMVLKAASLATSVARYSGLVEDRLKLRVGQLVESELGAAIRTLQQATDSENEEKSLLRDARSHFNKAIGLEQGFRLAAAYLGLALCHVYLGDGVNAEKAVSELSQMPLPYNQTLYGAVKVVDKRPWMIPLIVLPFGEIIVPASKIAARMHLAKKEKLIAEFEAVQNEAAELLKLSLRDGCDRVFGLSGARR